MEREAWDGKRMVIREGVEEEEEEELDVDVEELMAMEGQVEDWRKEGVVED